MTAQAASSDFEPFWREVDPKVAAGLDEFQKSEILKALSRRANASYPADVRLTLFGYFLVIIFGRERRSKERLQAERQRRPVITIQNLPVIFIIWGSVVYTAFALLLPLVRSALMYFL
ncbi:MAG: hypothetical protein KDJ77_12160 [Rhodobiaceae bacterium]|nr:hypothetical protein [Rhodobiaceae bacterium]